ncbi:hypothetical protein DFQ28_000543 [Apophysomyces sp. BC1034]|nr:hypothetical protein DFQ28_000543 [Apophysomyces sp. BC1034]
MNLLLAKLLPRRAARAAAALLAASLALALPATAQSTDSPDLTDILSTPTLDEQKALPRLALTSQLVYQVLAAEIALQRSQLAPAYQTYLALARDTMDPRFAQRATEIALFAQSPVDALNAARLWQQYAPQSDRASQIDASLLVLAGKPDEAKPLLEQQLAKVPPDNHASALLDLQLLLARGPNRTGGLRVLQDLLHNDMDEPEANYAIARQQALADDRDGARQSLRTALKQKPDFLPAVLLLAQLGPQERTEATQRLSQYVQKNPKAHDARMSLAQLYLASDRLDDAKAEFTRLAKDGSHDLLPLMALALIEIQQRNLPSAQHYLQQYIAAARRQPNADPGQAYLYLAQIALEQKDDQAASQWLDKIPPGSTQYLAGQITRAQIIARDGKVDNARSMLAALRPAVPREAALIARTDGAILFDAKRYTEAQARLAQAAKTFPDDPDLIYDYAMAAEHNGQYDVMEKQLRELIKLQPENPQAYNALGYSLADRNQRLDEASELIEKALSLAPDDAFIMDSAGWLKYRLGDKLDAAKVLRRAYDLLPNAEIGAHLGEVLWENGERDQARAAWRNARKLEPHNDTLVKTLKRFQRSIAPVSGCASPGATPTVHAYRGRFAVSYEDQNGQPRNAYGNFDWQETGGTVKLQLLSPLGQTLAIIASAPGLATLELPNKAPRTAPNVSDLMRSTLGFSLPIEGLRYWLQPSVSPRSRASTSTDGTGRLSRVEQDGWTIEYVAYANAPASRIKRVNLTRQAPPLAQTEHRMIETDDMLRDCAAPAKLNLFLHITGRRPDGYHALQTVFQLLDWGDLLHFRRRDDGTVRHLSPLANVPEQADLTVRAAKLLQHHSGCRYGVDIDIDKHLPMGAGLGGGSSDAATTLLALNRLWRLHLPRATLQALALELGADVPFFVFGRNAFAQGVGEQLEPVELPARTFLVVKPPVNVPTVEIFQSETLTRETKRITIADFLAQRNTVAYSKAGNADWPDNFGRNDMQSVVARKYAEVAQVLDWFSTIAPARMTGSGASVFAAFRSWAEAELVQAKLPADWPSAIASSLDRHPLYPFAS